MAEQFNGLPMKDLIGGPLMAAADANNAMAITQTKFLLDTCFQKTGTAEGKDENYTPILIKMSLTRGVLGVNDSGEPTYEEVSTTFNLPILTILPLNSLAVDNVDIAFHMEVKSSYGEETSKEEADKFSGEGSFSAKIGYGVFSAEVKGSVSYSSDSTFSENSHYEKSNSAEYDVKVHAGQIPLPDGVKTIIDVFANSIDPIEMPK
ncbi:MAG: DUF2589 domain-containing protein [Flavobacteriaceae bacterium]|nr:MAG: DUF2589 domain-containing protein [Flavobacteriaceae bacterium]